MKFVFALILIGVLNLKCNFFFNRCNCENYSESSSKLFTILAVEENNRTENFIGSCTFARNDSCITYEKGKSSESSKSNCSALNGKFELNSSCSKSNSIGECNFYTNGNKFFSKSYYNISGKWNLDTAKSECLDKLKGEWKLSQ